MVLNQKNDIDDILSRIGLVYSNDDKQGFSRRKKGDSYIYYDNNKRVITKSQNERLNGLAIPPSYKNVWYCKKKNGYIQATGEDQTGKKQYFYHDKWRAYRDSTKYQYLSDIAEKLPAWRRKIRRDLMKSDEKTQILAMMCRLLDRTGMRVGNKKSARENDTYGLTTLKKRHLKNLNGTSFVLDYSGKGNVSIEKEVDDTLLCEMLQDIVEDQTAELFTYEGHDNQEYVVSASLLNDYLKDTFSTDDISAKDLRTWRFSVLFLKTLLSITEKGDKVNQTAILKSVSEVTGNTPAILKTSYVHPGLLEIAKDDNIKPLKRYLERKERGLRKYEAIFKGYLKGKHAATHVSPINI